MLGWLEEAAADGVALHAQVAARPVGLMLGLSASLHPFSTMPAYREIAHLPLAERVAILRRPDFRARLLGERRNHRSRLMQDVTGGFHKMFTLGDPPDYEPAPESSVLAEAERKGLDPRELVLDRMLEREGRELIFFPFVNYSRLDHGDIRRMMDHPRTVLGLGDGGAHCGLISDASIPTYVLTHWGRDRSRGPGFPLPRLVKAQTAETAALYGFSDRGRLEPGLRADINIIDFEQPPAPPAGDGPRPAGRRPPAGAAGRGLPGDNLRGRSHLRGGRGHRRAARPARPRGMTAPENPFESRSLASPRPFPRHARTCSIAVRFSRRARSVRCPGRARHLRSASRPAPMSSCPDLFRASPAAASAERPHGYPEQVRV